MEDESGGFGLREAKAMLIKLFLLRLAFTVRLQRIRSITGVAA